MTVWLAVLAAGVTGFRWLRVAQREHYLPGSVTRFAIRWWKLPENLLLVVILVALGTGSEVLGVELLGMIALILATVGPLGLSWRGRTSPLALTGRLWRTAIGVTPLVAAAGLAVAETSWILPLVMPVLVDATLAVAAPIEKALGRRWVRSAAEALGRSGAAVVAITGSYGKTTTKVATAHLLAGLTPTVASPASFNNRMGLARAINEHLTPGTGVFVAEMGTYGAGEIAELCTWIPPKVSAITAIGPVHLERMRTLDAIAAAKREILGSAEIGVLDIDDPRLAAMAAEEARLRRIVTVSTQSDQADVCVFDGEIIFGGHILGQVGSSNCHPQNLAMALGIVAALGFDLDAVIERIDSIPVVPHRRSVAVSDRGVSIIDDTFNSNPAGARVALASLAAGGGGRKVLVTPGMVELGSIQSAENRELAKDAAATITDLVIVGRTNRAALRAGAVDGGVSSVIVVKDRATAVTWVREHLGSGDTVLYENDLPDHYP